MKTCSLHWGSSPAPRHFCASELHGCTVQRQAPEEQNRDSSDVSIPLNILCRNWIPSFREGNQLQRKGLFLPLHQGAAPAPAWGSCSCSCPCIGELLPLLDRGAAPAPASGSCSHPCMGELLLLLPLHAAAAPASASGSCSRPCMGELLLLPPLHQGAALLAHGCCPTQPWSPPSSRGY